MKHKLIVAATAVASASGAAQAQSNVRIYGLIDVGIEYARRSDGAHLTRLMQTGHMPSRLGFEGREDLGNGLHAGFRLEQGFATDTGAITGNRGFGREAWVSLGKKGWGELRLGRQYSLMQLAIAKYDPDHLTPYSPGSASQLSNTEQTSQDNQIKYQSPTLAGFTATLTASLGEKTRIDASGGPQVVGAGTLGRSHGAMLEYAGGRFIAGLGYLNRDQTLDRGGQTTQTMTSLGGIYRFDRFEVGALYWQHRNELPNGRAPKTAVWTVGTTWHLTPSLHLLAQIGQGRDNGLAYATGAPKKRGESTYFNLGASYDFSKRTLAYIRVGRIADHDGGFNGRAALAAPTLRTAMPLGANQSVRTVMLGLRHRF